jgi:hypothetical protein
MAFDYQLDAVPFFHILHTLLRHDELGYDPDEKAKAVQWVRTNNATLRKVLSSEEWRVVMVFYGHWEKHKIAPNRKLMNDLVRAEQKCEPMLQMLEQYDLYAEDFEERSYLDLDLFLDQRKLDYERYTLAKQLDIATQIALGSVPNLRLNSKSKDLVTLTGPRDAIRFLFSRFQEGVLLDSTKRVGGDTATEGAVAVSGLIENAALGRHKGILTGTPLDEALSIGPRAGIKFIGIMGFSGQRKSTLLFTLAYLAALQKHRVLFVPRECSVEEAWVRVYWLHADYIKRLEPQSPLAKRVRELPPLAKVRDDRYAKRKHAAIIAELAEDMKRRGIRIEVESLSTFAEVKQCAEAHVNDPYDVLCVDYLGHLDTPGQKDRIEGQKMVFRAAQMLSQDYEDRRGLVVITPVQANKTAQRDAAAPEAPLDKGIYPADIGQIEYLTDAGRDMDAIIGIWSGEGFHEHGLARISCVKTRQQDFRPFFMSIDKGSQMMSYISDDGAATRLSGQVVAAQERLQQVIPATSGASHHTLMKVEDTL